MGPPTLLELLVAVGLVALGILVGDWVAARRTARRLARRLRRPRLPFDPRCRP